MVFGTFDDRRHPRVRILGTGLGAHGDEVIHCNEPLDLSTDDRVAMLQQPWRLPLLAWRLASCWTRLIRRARSVGAIDVVLVGYLGHFDVVLARLLFRKRLIVLDHLVSAAETAADRGETGSFKQSLLRLIDVVATACADVVIVDTDEAIEVLPRRARRKAVVAPVGASREWFAARHVDHAVDRPDRPMRVVFFGQFAPLQGAAVITAALASVEGVDIHSTVIGAGQDHAAARRAAGEALIAWHDWVEPEQLPALVARHDVCVGILGTTPKARRVVPNKVFQGAAAGCAIVTSDSAPQRRALDEAAVYVPAGDAEALATALKELAADRARLAQQRHLAATHADAYFTPSAVVADLRKRLVS